MANRRAHCALAAGAVMVAVALLVAPWPGRSEMLAGGPGFGYVALDLDGGEMPIPIDDNNAWPMVPGSNSHMFGGYEPASPRDNPCARFGGQAQYFCDRSGRCGCTRPASAQLGFMGGAGVEGGQGNSDSIYGSHDDHSTFGVAGGGWQGPGNGEAPGDLWSPAVGQRYNLPQSQQARLQRAARGAGMYGGIQVVSLDVGDLPVPIGYDGDRDRIVPGSNIHMYEHGVPTTIPFDTTDYSPYVVPSYSDPNYARRTK